MDLGKKMSEPANDYTIIDNEMLRDNRLTASELGLLVYLAHLPKTWKIQPIHLADRFDCNRTTIYKLLNRLKDLGYVEYTQSRKEGSFSGGTWKLSKSPYAKKPDTVESTLLSTKKLLNTNSTKDTETDWREALYDQRPSCVTQESWQSWIDYKIEKNKNRKISNRVVAMSRNRLIALHKKGFETSGIIEVTISKNWQGIGDETYQPYQRFKRDPSAELLVI